MTDHATMSKSGMPAHAGASEGARMTDARQVQTFTNWLIEQRGGTLHGELTERMAEVVGAVREHGKAGSLSVKITVKPSGDGSMVQVSDDVTVSVPQPDRGASLFFTTHEGGLSRRNPDQPELPLRDASLGAHMTGGTLS